MTNPKMIAFLQTVFYGALFAIIPIFVTNLGAGGALNGLLPGGVTLVIITILNYIENSIQSKTGNALFGTIS